MQVVKTKTQTITSTESVTLVKNLFRASFSSIAYVRGLFDDEHFAQGKIGPTKYRKLLDKNNEEVKRYLSWVEEGVFDALSNKYLEVVLLEIYDGIDSTKLLECFSFRVSYTNDGVGFSLGAGSGKGATSPPNDLTKDSVTLSTSKVICNLIKLCVKLKPLPSNRIISMKLQYTKETPADYEPPLFKKAPSGDGAWFQQNLRRFALKPNVLTPYHQVNLLIRSANIIVEGMRPLANAIKAAKERKEEEEKRLAVERAAFEQKKRKVEEERRLPRISAEKEKARQARIAAEKAEQERLARVAAKEEKNRARGLMKRQQKAAASAMTKELNARKTAGSTKKKDASNPPNGKISKPRTQPRRSNRKKKPTFIALSSSASDSSVDRIEPTRTLSKAKRKTSRTLENMRPSS